MLLVLTLPTADLTAQTGGRHLTPAAAATFQTSPELTAVADYALPPGHRLRLAYVHTQGTRVHAKYHHYYRGQRVLNGTVVFHAENGRLLRTSGYLGEFADLDLRPKITPAQGEANARRHLYRELQREGITPGPGLHLHDLTYAVATANFPFYVGQLPQ